MNHIIDATGKSIGRVATEAARLLMGKNITSFKRNAVPYVTVKIENTSLARITERREKELFHRYSGYPGGLKTETLGKLSKRRGYGEIFRRAVKGMLPKNKLQAKMLKRLIVSE